MIASLLLLMVAAPDVPTGGAADIVVLGQRLRTVATIVARDPEGRLGCTLTLSTGNDALDHDLCRTAASCARKGAETAEAVRACVDARKPELLDKVRTAIAGGRA
ncbi:MAG: hypothetical protein ABW048_03650 [Sphingobium sp.]